MIHLQVSYLVPFATFIDSTAACCCCRFILFIGVYSFIVNNQSMGRFIRYNAMQAVLLDILLM
jgi:hypothetical protein